MLKDLLLLLVPRFTTELNMVKIREHGLFDEAWPLMYYQENDEKYYQHLAYMKMFTWFGFDYVFHQNIELLDWPDDIQELFRN